MRIFRFSQRCSWGFLFLDMTPDSVVVLSRGVEIYNSALERTTTTLYRKIRTWHHIPPQSLKIVPHKLMLILILVNNLLKFRSRSLDLVYACAESEVHLHDHNHKRGTKWMQNQSFTSFRPHSTNDKSQKSSYGKGLEPHWRCCVRLAFHTPETRSWAMIWYI
jgi:hypothetical protein